MIKFPPVENIDRRKEYDCGCVIFTFASGSSSIFACPVHNAAPALLAALQELTLRANQLIESAEANPTGSMVAVDMQDLGRLHMARDKAEQALARAEEAPGSGD